MPLIKSISGIRGTIGGLPGNNLTPQDIVESVAAFAQWVKESSPLTSHPLSLTPHLSPLTPHLSPLTSIVVGRDGRISGDMVAGLVIQTLRAMGMDVVDLGLSTTPTVEVAVPAENAAAGIIVTASHNPRQWNALKFLNHCGEFISAADGQRISEIARQGAIEYAPVDKLGCCRRDDSYLQKHLDSVLALPLVDAAAIEAKKFRVVVDCINSTGALIIPQLLEKLGCEVILLNGDVSGNFAHNPEPLAENLTQLSETVKKKKAHLGIALDPDVDRVAFVSEDGEMFGEEYTLVAVADYVLSHQPGNTVSNLSSTRALRDVTQKRGGQYFAAAVGEVNVVTKMKEVNAVIGGEGNGGVIYPALHYGRDAVVGVALFLSLLARFGRSASILRRSYPIYFMSKNKIQLDGSVNLDHIFESLAAKYRHAELNTADGLKIDLPEGWIHLRRSNTEPIMRIYSESDSQVVSSKLAEKVMGDIRDLI